VGLPWMSGREAGVACREAPRSRQPPQALKIPKVASEPRSGDRARPRWMRRAVPADPRSFLFPFFEYKN